MSNIAVIGTGYVGLTTGAFLAHLGHHVVCGDVDATKVDRLRKGEVPILEDGLPELIEEGVEGGRLQFVLGDAAAVQQAEAEFVFLCVPTPQGEDGSADLSYIEAAARSIGPVLVPESVVINKSTVPVGSTLVVERALGRGDVSVVSNPEFLREGSAVHDCLHPDRIVIGSEDQAAAIRVASLYSDIKAPVIVTDPASAETIKYASNAFLATKLSFVNAIANLCEAVGADVRDVIVGMGYDTRIGFEFLKPGPGWGGSCFHPDETVLARHREGGTRLLTFAELFSDVERLGTDGWEVLSWRPGEPRPEFFPVSHFTCRPYEGSLVEVRTKMGRVIRVTPDHPMVVGDGLDPDPQGIKLAGTLTTSDWLPTAIGYPLSDDAPSFESPRSEDPARLRIRTPERVESDYEFWWMVGLFLAEGHHSRVRGGHALSWTLNRHTELHMAERLWLYWRRLGVPARVQQVPTALQVVVTSREVGEWFERMRLGHRSYDKRLPDSIWAEPEAHKRALLRGLWDGDGSWSLVNGGPSVVLEYGTGSRALADGMLRLLAQLGIVARQRVGQTAKSTVDTYWLQISGADQVEASGFLVPEDELVTIEDAVRGQAKRIAATGYRRISKAAAWMRVINVQQVEYSGNVYSLHVPMAETVVSSGNVICHNCFPKDTRALIRIAEDSGYDFSLLKGVIDVNEEQFERITGKVVAHAGGSVDGVTVAAWGLTFKARTDDMRMSPALEVIRRLRERGATVRAYDPAVKGSVDGVAVCADPYAAAEGASVLVVLTEWDEFRWVDFEKVAGVMADARIVDARNLLDPASVRRRGFVYEGLGRP